MGGGGLYGQMMEGEGEKGREVVEGNVWMYGQITEGERREEGRGGRGRERWRRMYGQITKGERREGRKKRDKEEGRERRSRKRVGRGRREREVMERKEW